MTSSSRRSSAFENDSISIPHERSYFEPFKFELALELWCEDIGISRTQYNSLRNILRMLESHSELNKLSESYVTLKNHINRQLSLLQMRKKIISLRSEKMTTATKNRKSTESEKIPTKNLIFFDLKNVFQSFLSSAKYRQKMHVEMTHFVDVSCELWHSHFWAFSIRITSDEFAHYSNSKSIFSSDFVYFDEKQRIEKIYEIKRNFRSTSHLQSSKLIIVRIQKAILAKTSQIDAFLFENQELLLTIKIHDVIESDVLRHIENVILNYSFEDSKINNRIVESGFESFLIKRVLKNSKLRLICHISSLRAELKIKKFTRDHFVKNFDRQTCIFVSLLIFIDDFELYRNSYRTLMRIYVIVAALTFKERARRVNVFSLTFESHDSNFVDVIDALKSLISLNEDTKVLIHEQKTLMCVFILTYIEDMSQQQENSEFKSQRATFDCRFCFVAANERHNLNFDVVKNDRFHHQIIQMRKEMNNIKQKIKKEAYDSKWNIDSENPSLTMIFSTLDLILSRSRDSAHSEYFEMTRQLHFLLLDAILTIPASKTYVLKLRHFSFSSKYARLQSSIHHFKSYSLFDHARWSIIISRLFRC